MVIRERGMNSRVNRHHKYRYHLNIPEASEIIENAGRSALTLKYGSKPADIIRERFNKELEIIKRCCPEDYYLAYLVAKKCEELGYVHSLRGCGGSSFVAYLLGITEVNPLPPHYYCPKCGQVEFADDHLFSSGIELNDREKKCPNCGSTMTGDGHNSPWEFLLGLEGGKEPVFDFNVSSRKGLFSYLGEVFGKDKVFYVGQVNNGATDVHPGRIIFVPGDLEITVFSKVLQAEEDQERVAILADYDIFDHIGIFENKVLNYIWQMEKRTGIPAESISLSGAEITDLLEHADLEAFPFDQKYTEAVKRIIEVTRPGSFAELLKIYGNIHGTGVWEDNNEVLADRYPLREMIAFREDVMLSLMGWGVSHDDAFRIAEKVRKGIISRRGFSDEEIRTLKNSNTPEWYIHSMEKVEYLFPKVHAVEYMNMYVRAIWYKKHFPDVLPDQGMN